MSHRILITCNDDNVHENVPRGPTPLTTPSTQVRGKKKKLQKQLPKQFKRVYVSKMEKKWTIKAHSYQ